MVRADLVGTKVTRASAWLDSAEGRLGQARDAFIDDVDGRDLALFHLFLAIQECIDIASHWLADEGWQLPDDASSSFDLLADHGIIDRDVAVAMRDAVGLRNRIAHGYAMLDYARVHAEAATGLPLLRSYLLSVARAAGIG